MEAFCEYEEIKEKENWKRVRWLATYVLNSAGKTFKKTFRAIDLFTFKDEMIKIDPEEREREAMETALYHSKMFPKLIKTKDGKPLIYGRDN